MIELVSLLTIAIWMFVYWVESRKVRLYHAAIANARKQGLLVPSVIAAVDEANFPQQKEK